MKLLNSYSSILLIFVITPFDTRPLRRWSQRKISWNFQDPYRYLTSKQLQEVRSIVREAFQIWAIALMDLVEIEEAREKADINVFFAKRNHSCYEEFDGKGGVVAHSMYPPFGVLHLDGDEEWYTKTVKAKEDSINLKLVLLHEIGHTLGLRHSRRKDSVMRKHYEKPPKTTTVQLSKYDIRAIRKLYGALDK